MFQLLKPIYKVTCILLFSEAVRGQASSNQVIMRKISNTNFEMISLGVTLYDISRLHCAMACHKNDDCFSFYFNMQTRDCTLGSWLVNATSQREPSNTLYTQGAFCLGQEHFNHTSYGNISTCLFISDDQKNYSDAKRDCQAMNANLYTMKVIEKLNIMMDAIRIKHPSSETSDLRYWVGLNNIERENEYRWEDDGSVMNMSSPYKQQIFHYGQPDHPISLEQCISYSSIRFRPLLDAGCETKGYVICEKRPHFNK